MKNGINLTLIQASYYTFKVIQMLMVDSNIKEDVEDSPQISTLNFVRDFCNIVNIFMNN